MTGTLLALAGCSSIVSQETCEIGNWEAQGYTDGSNGKSPDRLSKIVEACSEYGLSVNNQAYYKGYEAGLPKYCTYERGYSRGESGSSYNQVCSGELAETYAPGFEEGREIYRIYAQYEKLVDRYEYSLSELFDLRARLQDADLTDQQRDRIRRNIFNLERDIDDFRYNIRQFERHNNIPRSRIARY